MISTVFFSGICLATYAAAGLIFFKLWRVSGDRLFRHFSLACWLIAAERVASVAVRTSLLPSDAPEKTAWVLSFRLAAFAVILWAIVDKNRTEHKKRAHDRELER